MAYLFIGHDLGVIRQVCGQVAVMYLGRIVEQGPLDAVFNSPAHPYTRALLAAAPIADPRRAREQTVELLRGETPDSSSPRQGCSFCPRCPDVDRVRAERGIDCARDDPRLQAFTAARVVACHLHEPGHPSSRESET